mmetsp:Transcript_20184/g.77280  ORF Transcript_20184/g.77280 Transcript_20184/m.77280 type:complete len:687 (+) Transcript_20184:163-2223(+)
MAHELNGNAGVSEEPSLCQVPVASSPAVLGTPGSPFFPSAGPKERLEECKQPEGVCGIEELPAKLQEMLELANWGPVEVERARGIFLLHTAPNAPFLTEEQFTNIMLTLGVSEGYCHRYFQAFDLNGNERVDWPEFLMGLAGMDPYTQHGGAWNVERGKYIFRVYDLDGDGRITTTDFLHMIRHIRRGQGLGVDPAEVHEHAREVARVLGRKKKPYIDQEDFMDAVTKLRFAGTSVLFRLARSPIKMDLKKYTVEGDSAAGQAAHKVKIKMAIISDEAAVEVSGGVWSDDGTGGVVDVRHSHSDVLMAEASEAGSGLADGGGRSREQFFFIPKEAHHKVDYISPKLAVPDENDPGHFRLLQVAKKIVKAVMGYDGLERDFVSRTNVGVFDLVPPAEIELLCRGVYDIVSDESCCVDVSPPVRIFGDLHGQLREAREFFTSYGSPDHYKGNINLVNYIFNGDFVDRGPRSLELICFLFAIKCLYPGRVFLVRGNHEDRQINYANGFYAECIRRLPTKEDGEKIWEMVNRVFDWLPLAARVAKAVLVLHGGVGATLSSIDDILSLERPITSEHIANSSLLQDILWSDPTSHDSEVGIHKNPPRGSGIVSFGADRVYEFCEATGIQMIVRSHQCVRRGFELFARGHMITVFSATNYTANRMNDGAVLDISSQLQVVARVIVAKQLDALI